MENPLKNLIEVIKTGSRKEVKDLVIHFQAVGIFKKVKDKDTQVQNRVLIFSKNEFNEIFMLE